MIHKSFAAIEHENSDNAGRTGELLAQSHMELQHRDAELQQMRQEVATSREELRCTETARNAACQQIQHLTNEMEKMALVCLQCILAPSANMSVQGSG